MSLPETLTIPAEPRAFALRPAQCALLVIDLQRDFLEPDGFGAALGNDVTHLRRVIEPNRRLIAAWRAWALTVVHTREGHLPDLSDLPETKRDRAPAGPRIGDVGPMGRILVRGEPGHAIIPELAPLPSETVIDKPGKGAFWRTNLENELRQRGIRQLVVTGVTTEVCVHSTVREANDRGFECLVPADATASYIPEFHASALRMISAQGGLFGWVCTSNALLQAFTSP